MIPQPDFTVLYRVDAERRMQRYYKLEMQPNLFGEWCVIREWGRIGSSGKVRSVPFRSVRQAKAFLRKHQRAKQRRGYAETY